MMMKTFILTAMLFASVSASSFRQTKEVVKTPIKSWNCSIVDNDCKCSLKLYDTENRRKLLCIKRLL